MELSTSGLLPLRELFLSRTNICGIRGVYGGNGHTSWTGRPETQDYISFAGFFAHYLDLIQQTVRSSAATLSPPPKLHPASATSSPLSSLQDRSSDAKLILGGYSYGSIIVNRLPSLREMLARFKNPEDGTAVAEILHRARTISGWTNEKLEAIRQTDIHRPKSSRKHSPSITMGGEETSSDQRRISRENGRRSVDFEGLRKSLDIPRRIKEHKSHSRSQERKPSAAVGDHADVDVPSIGAHYLLISPVLGIIGSALSAFGNTTDVTTTLASEPTLVVYGDNDVFTTTRKIRQWTQKLSSSSGRFRAVEVNGAGHFWREHGVAERLSNAIEYWVKELREPPVQGLPIVHI